MLTINENTEIPESSKDEIPVLFDCDSRRFLCCDKNHVHHEAISLDSAFPVNKKFKAPNKPEKLDLLIHFHGRYIYNINPKEISDEYILENGGYLTIFNNKLVRAFKKPMQFFDYLKKKSWISLTGLNRFKMYNFLRRDLLVEDEKWLETNSSINSEISAADPRSRALQKRPPNKFDDKTISPKISQFKNKFPKLQARRLKDARHAIRIHNFEKKKLKSKLKDLKRKYQHDDISINCKHCKNCIF